MSNHEQLVFDSAITFIRAGMPHHLPGQESRLIDGCMEVLQVRHSLTAQKAERISLSALAEVQSRKDGLIDMELSNSHVVFLRDPEKREVYAFSAARLGDLAGQHGMSLSHP